MAHKTRVNPKTGKTEYKVRYYFMKDGKKRDSETAWFSTLEKAEKEAKTLKEEKEKADRHKVTQRRDKKLITAYEDFGDYLYKEMLKEKTNTDRKEYEMCKAIMNNHMPEDIKEVRIKDLNIYTWRSWLSHINSKDGVGGGYIRLCRLNLTKFNAWLSQNGYYIDELQEETFDIGIRKTKIKGALVNNKERNGERALITILDIQKTTRYYIDKEYGLGDFKNFYFYTLFYVLFYSGMRVEELVGLQWKFIDLRESQRTISIKNAISRMERVEHALERVRKGIYRTKNPTSVRTIPIFDFYYDLLKDYKESYRYEYNVSKEEVEECFVFPNLKQNNPYKFMDARKVLAELNKTRYELGMEKSDLQMYRHSCATFLVLPPPDGLGYSEEKVKDYFGHQDTDMLNKVYARLNVIQKSDRMRHTFSDIYKPIDNDDRTVEEQMKEKLLDRIGGHNEKYKYYARKIRIHNQIKKQINVFGAKQYKYFKKDKSIIDEFIKENGNIIEFVEVEE